MAHRDLHPTYTEGCMGCKVLSVSVSAHALENKGGSVRVMDAKEQALEKDLRAYKEMRDGGLQPKRVDGSADVVRGVSNQWDIDLGRNIPKSEESRVREGFDACREMGLMQ